MDIKELTAKRIAGASVGVPALVLSLAGLAHPRQLSLVNADRWHDLHVVLLLVFPLLGAALWWLVRAQRREIRWTVGLLAFVYAALYSAQDAIIGVGLGAVMKDATSEDVAKIGEVASPALFAEGNSLARIGLWCFLAACIVVGVSMVRTHGRLAVPGALLLGVAAYSFLDSHVYWPRGGLTMLGMAAGLAALGVVHDVRPRRSVAAMPNRPSPRTRQLPTQGRKKPASASKNAKSRKR